MKRGEALYNPMIRFYSFIEFIPLGSDFPVLFSCFWVFFFPHISRTGWLEWAGVIYLPLDQLYAQHVRLWVTIFSWVQVLLKRTECYLWYIGIHQLIDICYIVIHRYCIVFLQLKVCGNPIFSKSIHIIFQQHLLTFCLSHFDISDF